MKGEIVDLTSRLVKVQSINPLYPGVETETVLGGEKQNNLILKPVVEKFGCKATFVEKAKERSNLVAVLKGTGGGRSLILNGHIDISEIVLKSSFIQEVASEILEAQRGSSNSN
jgi:acetylornithine deacetylase